MAKITQKKNLILPALRAQMGDWIYYISSMRMADIAERISYAEEIHKGKELNELLQRQLSNRKKYIVKYMETQKQRFFNTIIVGVYMGKPEWFELEIEKNRTFDPKDLPEYIKNVVGFLKLSGREKLFAIDGQHRVAAIRDVVKKDQRFADEEVSTIFVSAHMDDEGKKRTRRLFSTLNRYAKPVKRSYIIALNEDDAIAITVRKLIEENTFFANNGKIYLETKNLRSNDYESFSSLEALYDCMDTYLRDKRKSEWENFKSIYPGEPDVDRYFKKADSFWNIFLRSMPALKKLDKANNTRKIIKRYRGDHGGNILFRPIGLIIVIDALRRAIDAGYSLKGIINKLSVMPMSLVQEPWNRLLWDQTKKSMMSYIGKDSQDVAAKLIYYMIHCDLNKIGLNKEMLKKQYLKAISWDVEKDGDLSLPHKVK